MRRYPDAEVQRNLRQQGETANASTELKVMIQEKSNSKDPIDCFKKKLAEQLIEAEDPKKFIGFLKQKVTAESKRGES